MPAASSASRPDAAGSEAGSTQRPGAAGHRAGWSDADGHLRSADPALRSVIDAGGPIDGADDRRGLRRDPFGALARAIVGQQVSTKAAQSIWERLEGTFASRTPTPAQIVAADPETVRAAGLSWRKVGYLRDLAERIVDADLDLVRLPELPDEEVIAQLTGVKGIGRWTAEMFLIVNLGRPDVLSSSDLGIRRAVRIAYGLDALPDPAELERIGEPWRPHRTLACLYLWRSLANAPT